MAVYDASGNMLYTVYDANGNQLAQAYDANGNPLLSGDVPDSYDLKVMTYNTGQWYIGGSPYMVPTDYKEAYYTVHNKIFTDEDVDICFFQETTEQFCADGTSAYDAILDKYFANIIYNNVQTLGAHMLATKTLTMSDYTETAFSGQTYSGGYPGYDKAYITVNGKRIALINTHLSTNLNTSTTQLQEIMGVLENEEYFIFAGDFNSAITSTSSTGVTNHITPLLNAGYNVANAVMINGRFRIYYTYVGTTTTGSSATDNIVTSSNIDIVEVHSNREKLTATGLNENKDHVPLVAYLKVN